MQLYEWINKVNNLEMGWTNQWCFMDNRDTLLSYRKEALAKKKELGKMGYDVTDIYKQLDEFEKCINKQKTLTMDEEEKILLGALEYAENNRPIITSKLNRNLTVINSNKEKEQSSLRYKFDVYHSLINFYLGYKKDIDLFDTIVRFIEFDEYLIFTYPKDKNNFYCTSTVIYYLKFLIREKQFEKAIFILSKFKLDTIGKTDAEALEKIKAKLSTKKLLSNDKA